MNNLEDIKALLELNYDGYKIISDNIVLRVINNLAGVAIIKNGEIHDYANYEVSDVASDTDYTTFEKVTVAVSVNDNENDKFLVLDGNGNIICSLDKNCNGGTEYRIIANFKLVNGNYLIVIKTYTIGTVLPSDSDIDYVIIELDPKSNKVINTIKRTDYSDVYITKFIDGVKQYFCIPHSYIQFSTNIVKDCISIQKLKENNQVLKGIDGAEYIVQYEIEVFNIN